jgi:hypothetical protein
VILSEIRSRAELSCALPLFLALRTNEIPRTDPLVQVDRVCVVDLDIGAGKSDVCAIRMVTTSERAGSVHNVNRAGPHLRRCPA